MGKTEPKKLRIEIKGIVDKLNINAKNLNDIIKQKKIGIESGQTLLKTMKGDLEILQTEKTRLEEVEKKKEKLKKEIDALTKISTYEEGSEDYNNYYNDVVNKVLVYKSITSRYEVARVRWIDSVAEDFIKAMDNDYYKKCKELNQSDYNKHINSCIKSPIFPELFSNIVMPLYNHKIKDGNMLLKVLNTLYPNDNNELQVEKILELYNTMNEEKHDLSTVHEVMHYTKQIEVIVVGVILSYYKNKKCHFLEGIADDNLPTPSEGKSLAAALLFRQQENHPSMTEAKLAIKTLKEKEDMTAKSALVELVFRKIKNKFGGCASTEHLVKSDPSKEEMVAFASGKVGTMLQDVEPFTIKNVISLPSSECLNPVQRMFPTGKVPTKVNGIIAEQWHGAGVYIPCC